MAIPKEVLPGFPKVRIVRDGDQVVVAARGTPIRETSSHVRVCQFVMPALHEDPVVTALCNNENSKNKLVFTVYAVSVQHDMPVKGFTLVGVHLVWADANWKGTPDPDDSRYLDSISTTVHLHVVGRLAKPHGAKPHGAKPPAAKPVARKAAKKKPARRKPGARLAARGRAV